MKKSRRALPVIGWREWAALPELGIDRIKVKIDTGARSSALHAFDLHTVETESGRRVRFRVHPVQRNTKEIIDCEAPLLGERWVRSSTGRSTLRPTITASVCLGSRIWPIEITLVRRDVMGFRMLLGRRAIRRRFVVDAGRSFLMELPRVTTATGDYRSPETEK